MHRIGFLFKGHNTPVIAELLEAYVDLMLPLKLPIVNRIEPQNNMFTTNSYGEHNARMREC